MRRKKSNSFKVKAENGGDAWSSPSSPRVQPDVPNAQTPDSASRVQMLHPAKQGSPAMSPRSPQAAWDQAIKPTTSRLPPPPAAPARADSLSGAPLERQSSHRKTTSWGGGGSPTAAGRSHRRTRSIEGLGASIDASENFRAELERIGSSGLSGAAKPSGQPAERPALALSPPRAHLLAPNPTSRRSSVGSPLQNPTRKSMDAIPPLILPPGAPTQQVTLGDRSAAEEQELISWDEVKDQKEVYRAVRTSDGRQALVKAGDGADQEELLFLEDPPRAAPDMSLAQGSHASAVYYVPTATGHGPMYVYPVQYPDGRIMYHILPPQVMSPVSSPHALPPHGPAQNMASPPYPCSPTAATTPPGHQRRSSVGTPSPLQISSGSAFGSTAFAPSFGSGPMGAGAPHMYTNSSGPLSPQLSQASSGFVQGASPNQSSVMSPAGSGHLPCNPLPYSHHAQPDHTALLEQLAGMRLAAAKDDPFGGSTVWAT
ncbi:g3738 [Coccomyxa viridis]|uniref:G3738 protein n=1 Tax=Coccomyxa viridis TaxID=1274662 RepID=A0ABP1FNI1_9CHLO